jgi:hypothetical protein
MAYVHLNLSNAYPAKPTSNQIPLIARLDSSVIHILHLDCLHNLNLVAQESFLGASFQYVPKWSYLNLNLRIDSLLSS